MNSSDAIAQLKACGFEIDSGYVFLEKFRYGRIMEEVFEPEGDGPIPLSEIDAFGNTFYGTEGFYLFLVKTDGTRLNLKRSGLPEGKGFTGLKPNPSGQGFLMPYSISELSNAWNQVFPDFESKCWKEITTGYIMVDLSLIKENGMKSLDDPMVTRITAFVQDQLVKLGCKGRPPGKETIGDVLIAKAELNSRNAFLEMMRSQVWDEEPRLDNVFVDVFGAKMRGLDEEKSEAVLRDICKCWFIGAVARQFDAIQLDIIPIMIGATGIRKSSAVRWIATCDDFYRDPLDISEKRFVEDTKGGLVVELAEMKATKGMDNDYLKGFISRKSDCIRLPYDRFATENIRRFVVIGTTNNIEFLSDPTGNRRYFPFIADPDRALVSFGEGGFRSRAGKDYILQVWAEAYHRYRSGEGWYPDPKTLELAKVAQELSVFDNPELDLLSELVDELYPLPGERLCKKDLEHILTSNSIAFENEAAQVADMWMKRPHPCWSPSTPKRIKPDERRDWLQRSCIQRCRERIQPVGYRAPGPTRMLGE